MTQPSAFHDTTLKAALRSLPDPTPSPAFQHQLAQRLSQSAEQPSSLAADAQGRGLGWLRLGALAQAQLGLRWLMGGSAAFGLTLALVWMLLPVVGLSVHDLIGPIWGSDELVQVDGLALMAFDLL